MNINDLIVQLREQAKTAQDVDMAVTLHEVWKPAANDKNLHQRLGKSYATPSGVCRPISGASYSHFPFSI